MDGRNEFITLNYQSLSLEKFEVTYMYARKIKQMVICRFLITQKRYTSRCKKLHILENKSDT